MKTKQVSLILGSAAIICSSASANLIINGDFETGITGTGYVGAGYTNEIGTFAPEITENPFTNDTSESNWVIVGGYQSAAFVDLVSPGSGWGVKMGNYSSSTVTNTATLSLAAGDYIFSVDHWGGNTGSELPTGSQFTATLIGVNSTTGIDQVIGTFTDTTDGSVQVSSTTFTLPVAGEYQLQLAGPDEDANKAWLDNISLTAAP